MTEPAAGAQTDGEQRKPMRFRVVPRGRFGARQRARDAVDFGGDLERRQNTPSTRTGPGELAAAPADTSRSSHHPTTTSSAADSAPRDARRGRRAPIQPPGPPAPAGPADTTQER